MKISYAVYDQTTLKIIRNGLTRNAAIKLANATGKSYGTGAWVELVATKKRTAK